MIYQTHDWMEGCCNAWVKITHWGRMTHICVSKLTIISSDNGLSPGRHQANIWTNAGILLIGPSGTNLSEIGIKIHTFSFEKMYLKLSPAKWRPFCVALNVIIKDGDDKQMETQVDGADKMTEGNTGGGYGSSTKLDGKSLIAGYKVKWKRNFSWLTFKDWKCIVSVP